MKRVFFNEFSDFPESITATNKHAIIFGDFNCHVGIQQDALPMSFLGTIDMMGFVQLVKSATHVSGNTLDLVFSRSCDNFIGHVKVDLSRISNHYFGFLNIAKPIATEHTPSYRDFRRVNIDMFKSDIADSPLCGDMLLQMPIDDLVNLYNEELLKILGKHALSSTRSVELRPNTQWYTESIREAKQVRRRYERMWRMSGLQVHKYMLESQKECVNDMLVCAKSKKYYSDIINDCGNDHKKLFPSGKASPAP